MQDISLQRPHQKYKETYLNAIKEYHAEGFLIEKINLQELENDFDSYIQKIENWEKGINLPKTFSTQTELWLIENKEYLGTIKIRHTLNNETLQKIGGHIGYFIRPSKRGLGLGNKILELALPEVKKIGLKEVLITCDVSNSGSKRVIENNGGEFDSRVENPPGEDKYRYWVKV